MVHGEPTIGHLGIVPTERSRSSWRSFVIRMADFIVEEDLSDFCQVITDVEVPTIKLFSNSSTQIVDVSEENLSEDDRDVLRKCYMIASKESEDEAEHSSGLSLDGDMPGDLTRKDEIDSAVVTLGNTGTSVAAKKPLSGSTGPDKPTHSLATGECRSDRKSRVATVESKPRGGDETGAAGITTSWGRHRAGVVADVVATTAAAEASGHVHHSGTRSGVGFVGSSFASDEVVSDRGVFYPRGPAQMTRDYLRSENQMDTDLAGNRKEGCPFLLEKPAEPGWSCGEVAGNYEPRKSMGPNEFPKFQIYCDADDEEMSRRPDWPDEDYLSNCARPREYVYPFETPPYSTVGRSVNCAPAQRELARRQPLLSDPPRRRSREDDGQDRYEDYVAAKPLPKRVSFGDSHVAPAPESESDTDRQISLLEEQLAVVKEKRKDIQEKSYGAAAPYVVPAALKSYETHRACSPVYSSTPRPRREERRSSRDQVNVDYSRSDDSGRDRRSRSVLSRSRSASCGRYNSGDDSDSDDGDRPRRRSRYRGDDGVDGVQDRSERSPSRGGERSSPQTKRKWIMPERFDGTSSFATFMGQFETCACYNGWNEEDKRAYLCTSLKGMAAMILVTDREHCDTYAHLVEKLTQRYGTEGQVTLFRTQLRTRRRGRDESLQALYMDIGRLAAIAYPGARTEHFEAITVDAFLEALQDADLELRVRDREPRTLDAAYKAAMTLEANVRVRSQRREEHREPVNRFQNEGRRVRNARQPGRPSRPDPVVSASAPTPVQSNPAPAPPVNAENQELREMMRKLTEQMTQMQQSQVHLMSQAPAPPGPPPRRWNRPSPPPNQEQRRACFNCGDPNHWANNCPMPRQAMQRDDRRGPPRGPPPFQRQAEPPRPRAPAEQNNTCYRCGQSGHYSALCQQGHEEARVTDAGQGPNRLVCTGRRRGKNPGVQQPVYIDVWFGNDKWKCLLDSGCDISIVPKSLLKGDEVLDVDVGPMYAANGTVIPVVGETDIVLNRNGLTLPTHVVVSIHVTEPILGADWLQRHGCLWDFGGGHVVIQGVKIPLQTKRGGNLECRRIVVDQDTCVPAWSVGNIDTKVQIDSLHGEVTPVSWMTENREVCEGVCVPRVVVPDRFEHVPVQVMNVTTRPIILKAGTVVSTLTPVQVADDPVTEVCVEETPEHLNTLLEQVDVSVGQEVVEKLRKLVCRYRDVFSEGEYDLGDTNVVQHVIDTGQSQPIKQQLRRQPVHLLEKIDDEVARMLNAGVIEPTCSPWASNVVIVKKKDGSLRFCIDYRRLNDVTRKDVYPLPRIDACLDAMGGAKYFSTFDLRSGYHQVQMHEVDADKTSFVTRQGAFRFRRLPFGLCNAGSTFQRLMDIVMKGANFEICLVYLDDIIVYSEDADDHLRRLEIVFSRLRAAHLKLKPSKCKILQKSVTFLGHVVSDEGLATDPEKISAVINWPRPVNQTEVRSFLGLCSYYRRFVRDFAAVASPLHALTGKNKVFRWDEACEQSFQQLKIRLTSSPILAMPTDSGHFILDTDACDISIGAVLSQVQDGAERVIAYASRKLSRPEFNYCVTRKELLAVVYYVKAFRMYLLGRPFLIRTDHSALQWLRKTPEPIGQQARWCEILEEFQFEIQHRPGRSHTNADAMSRRPCRQCGDGAEETAVKQVRTVLLNRPVDRPDSRYHPDALAKAYEEDPELRTLYELVKAGPEKPNVNVVNGMDAQTKSYVSQWNVLSIVNGGLYRRFVRPDRDTDFLQLIPPESYRREIVETAHAGLTSNHLGLRRTRLRVQSKAYWLGWSRYVEGVFRRCDRCARYYRGAPKRQGELQAAPVGEVFERLAIDVTGPHPKSSNGYVYIVTMLDLFSKWAFAFPVRNHEASTVAHLLVDRVFSVFGIPQQLLSDRGPEFEGSLIRELCAAMDIDKLRTTAYKPSTNGAIERFHRSLNSLLGKVVEDNQRDWDQWLPAVLAAYHASPHESTGFTPNYLMFGRELRVPLDLAFGEPPVEEGFTPVYADFVEERRLRLRRAFELARQNLAVAAQRRKDRYDLKVRPAKFSVGDFVWYYYPRKLVGKSAKWQAAYQGPFMVVNIINEVNYIIQRSPRSQKQVVHVDKMKPCYSESREPWLTPQCERGAVEDGCGVDPVMEMVPAEAEFPAVDESPPSPVEEVLDPPAPIAQDSQASLVVNDVVSDEARGLRDRRHIRPPRRYCHRVIYNRFRTEHNGVPVIVH